MRTLLLVVIAFGVTLVKIPMPTEACQSCGGHTIPVNCETCLSAFPPYNVQNCPGVPEQGIDGDQIVFVSCQSALGTDPCCSAPSGCRMTPTIASITEHCDLTNTNTTFNKHFCCEDQP